MCADQDRIRAKLFFPSNPLFYRLGRRSFVEGSAAAASTMRAQVDHLRISPKIGGRVMTAVPAWSGYQEEAAEFFRSLGLEAETNVAIKGVRTSHDIDVVVRSRHAGFDVMWVVECKRWNSRVTKLHVLALREIVSDTGADRGILLAENGFQSGAVEAASLTNVHIASLANTRVEASSEISRMRLADLFDRIEICREQYWSIPKDVRIEHGLRAEYCEHNYSGDWIVKFAQDALRKAFRGVYPFETDHMAATMFPGSPRVMNTAEEVIATLTPQVTELEKRLNSCLSAIGTSGVKLPG